MVDMPKKVFYPLSVLAVTVLSLIVCYSISDSYSIDLDTSVSPLAVPGLFNGAYAFEDGNLKIYNSRTDSYSPVNYLTPFATILDAYGVATLDDVQASAVTIPDIVSALKTYFSSNADYKTQSKYSLDLPGQLDQIITSIFSSYPLTFSIYRPGSSSQQSLSINSLGDLFSYFYRDLSYDLMIQPNQTFLNTVGSRTSISSTLSLSNLLQQGILGLSSNLVSQNGSRVFSRTSSTGSLSTNVYDLLHGLSIIDSDLMGNLFVNGTNSVNVPQIGSTGNRTVVFSNLGDSFADLFSTLSSFSVAPTGQQYLSYLGQRTNSTANRSYDLLMLNSLMGIGNILNGNTPGYYVTHVDYSDLEKSVTYESNLMSLLAGTTASIQNDLATYLYSHGTDMDIDIRHNMQEQADTIVDEFTSANGSGTPSVGQFSDMAKISSSTVSTFQSDATPSDVFVQLSDSNNWNFFSSEVLNELNPFESTRILTRSVDLDFYNPLDNHLSDIQERIGSTW